MQGVRTRTRPVVMTAMMASFGLMPAAFSKGIGSESQKPLAIVIIGGLTTATVLTLLVFAPAHADGFVFSAWPSLQPADWGLIVFLALMHPVIEVAVAKAYQLAPATTIGVFDNAYLPFAAFWGFVLLSQTPSWSETIGIILIGAAGVIIARCR